MSDLEEQVEITFKRSTTKSFTQVFHTPVILVCLNNKNQVPITPDLLYPVFEPYGTIQRIAIIEKDKVWKAHVEYASATCAVEAKINLDDFMIFNDGTRLNVYYTSHKTIKHQINENDGVDYTLRRAVDTVDRANSRQDDGFRKQTSTQTFVSQNSGGSVSVTITNNKRSPESTKLANNRPDPFEQNLQSMKKYDDNEDLFAIINKQQQQIQGNINSNQQPIPQHRLQPQEDFKQENMRPKISDRHHHQPHHEVYEQPEEYYDEDDTNEKRGFEEMKAFFSFNNQQQPGQVKDRTSSYNEIPYWQKNPLDSIGNEEPQNSIFGQNPNNNNNPPIKKQSHPPGLNLNPKFHSFDHIHVQSPGLRSNEQQSPYMMNNSSMPNANGGGNGPNDMHKDGINQPNLSNFGRIPQSNSMSNIPKLNQTGSMGHIPQVQQTGSMSNIPQINKFSSFQQLSQPGGGMNNQMGNMHQQQNQKPNLNARFHSNPELKLSSGERKNLDLGDLNNQGMMDMIEKEILAKLMNMIQSQGGPDDGQAMQELASKLQGLNLSQDQLSQFQNLNQGGLQSMNKQTLNQLYNNLSMLLGKEPDSSETKKSQVLYVKGLEHKDIRVTMLYNIFSNFGNILKIIFIRSRAAALLEFENVEYATISKDYFNNIVFMGKPLRITYSKYNIINIRNKKSTKDEEIYIGQPKSFRFKKNKPMSINPPSSTIHISNLVKDVCREDIIREYFSPYGRIEAMKFLFMEGNKNMCLMRMASMEESLSAMGHLHDTDLGGRKVQISFTKSKI